MRAIDYVKAQPFNEPPEGDPVPADLRREAILDALRGVELGAYDQQTVYWVVNMLDAPMSRVIVSSPHAGNDDPACAGQRGDVRRRAMLSELAAMATGTPVSVLAPAHRRYQSHSSRLRGRRWSAR